MASEINSPANVEERELIERVLASGLFRKSPRLSGFLRFVYEEQAQGREAAINEQLIGTEVFGRRPGYHVGEDSIVRSQARFLRQRLEQYFDTDGRGERLIVVIPKGSYIPAFKEREVIGAVGDITPHESSAFTAGEDTHSSEGHRKRPGAWRHSVWPMALAVALLLTGLLYPLVQSKRLNGSKNDQIVHTFWVSIFNPKRSVLFIPADSSLVTWERISNKPVHLSAYINRDYMQGSAESSAIWDRLANSRYTSMADLDLVQQLDLIPEANSHFQIRYCGDLSLAELKNSNAILSGGMRANPWVELFASTMHFDVDYDWDAHYNFVRNRSDAQKPDQIYAEKHSSGTQAYEAYGVIGYIPSLDGQGHNLLIEGTSKTGNEAAAEFLRSDDFPKFLRQIGATETRIPDFEILVAAQSLASGSYNTHIVEWHKLSTQ